MQHPHRTHLARYSGQIRWTFQVSTLTCWLVMTSIISPAHSCCRRHSWWMVWEVRVTVRLVAVPLGIGKGQRIPNRYCVPNKLHFLAIRSAHMRGQGLAPLCEVVIFIKNLHVVRDSMLVPVTCPTNWNIVPRNCSLKMMLVSSREHIPVTSPFM